MAIGGGPAHGVVVIGMDVDTGDQRGLDAINVAQASQSNQCFFLRVHAVILAATVEDVQVTGR